MDLLTKLQIMGSQTEILPSSDVEATFDYRVAVCQAEQRIKELQACIRKHCPEMAARKSLSFAAAEAVFSG